MICTGGSGLTEPALAMRKSFLVGKRVEAVCDGVGGSRLLMQYNYRRREEAPILEFSCFFRKQLVNVVTARLAVKAGLLAQFTGEPFIPERNVTSYVTVDVRSMKNVLKNLVKDLYAVG